MGNDLFKLQAAISLLLSLFPLLVNAHQPVMDMAPRWSGGYGFQIRHERILLDKLERDGEEVGNPDGLRSEADITWVEGVYTFHRSVRVTFKLPYELREKRLSAGSQPRDAKASGFGDLILALPIKRYRNYLAHTTNLAFTPSVILPTGSTKGDLPLGRGTVDYGLSVSLAREATRTFGLWDLFTKIHTQGADGKTKGNSVGFDMNVGIYPYQDSRKDFSTLILWGTHARWEDKDKIGGGGRDGNTGGFKLEMAPIAVVLWRNMALRVETYLPVYKNLNGTQLTGSYTLHGGFGITFPSPTPF